MCIVLEFTETLFSQLTSYTPNNDGSKTCLYFNNRRQSFVVAKKGDKESQFLFVSFTTCHVYFLCDSVIVNVQLCCSRAAWSRTDQQKYQHSPRIPRVVLSERKTLRQRHQDELLHHKWSFFTAYIFQLRPPGIISTVSGSLHLHQ